VSFSIKKGDLVYTSDGTLGFVSDVYRSEQGDHDEGWAAVNVPGLDGPVYFTGRDVRTRDETVPSVLLTLTYAEATGEDRRRQPEAVTSGSARKDETPLLEVGRPELPGGEDASGEGSLSSEPGGVPHPDAVRDWPTQDAPRHMPGGLA
jgi:hypothetical protein